MHDEAKPGVDVVFGLGGTSLPHDHAEALARAVAVWLPWLADEPSAGIHPLRTAPTIGKFPGGVSLDTVRMFHRDATTAGYTL